MKCFCTPSTLSCPPSRQKQCDPDVSHCFLSLKWSISANRFVENIQDCWQWTDKQNCPEEPGPCHILEEFEGKSKTCCCKGELCNNATEIQFVLPTGLGVTTFNKGDLNLNKSESFWNEKLQSASVTSSNTKYVLVLTLPVVLFALFVLVTLIFLCFCRRRLKTLNLKQGLGVTRLKPCPRCQALKITAPNAKVNCNCVRIANPSSELEHLNNFLDSRRLPTVGIGWLTDDEIEGLSSVVTKVELKSQGCFGQVWHGQLAMRDSTKHTSQLDVAVKIFGLAHKDSWEAELSLFRVPGLPHPNILKFYGADQVITSYSEPPETELWIVTEYHPLGSLHDYLKTHTVSWCELLRIATGIARGLCHLHSESTKFDDVVSVAGHCKPSIAHRDLNSRNVLLKLDLSACIADFGLAIRFEPGQLPAVAHPQLGTRRYMAPEVLDGAIQFSRDAYLRIDVYAMGLVFWELMSRCRGTDECQLEVASPYRAPYELELGPTPTIADLERLVAHENQRPKFSPGWIGCQSISAIWETVEECWDQDAEARLSAGCVAERLSCLSHLPWSGRLPAENVELKITHTSVNPYPQPMSFTSSGVTTPLLTTSQTTIIGSHYHHSINSGPVSCPVQSASIVTGRMRRNFPNTAIMS